MQPSATIRPRHISVVLIVYVILYYKLLYYAILCCTMLCYNILYYAMLCYAILCYAMLCYAMLYYTTLCYAILYYTILYYTILCYTMLYYTILYYTTLDYTIIYYTILYYTILYYTILYYTIPYDTILYFTILYFTILYYTILYYTILYYTILLRDIISYCTRWLKPCGVEQDSLLAVFFIYPKFLRNGGPLQQVCHRRPRTDPPPNRAAGLFSIVWLLLHYISHIMLLYYVILFLRSFHLRPDPSWSAKACNRNNRSLHETPCDDILVRPREMSLSLCMVFSCARGGRAKRVFCHCLHSSIRACHPCAGALLIFSVSF